MPTRGKIMDTMIFCKKCGVEEMIDFADAEDWKCPICNQPERLSEKDAKVSKLPDSLNWCDATSVCDSPNTPTKGSEPSRND